MCRIPVLLVVCFLALLPSRMIAEEIVFAPNQPIEVLLRKSEPTRVNVRTIVFPRAVVDVPVYHNDEDVHVQIRGNTLLMHLRNPEFRGTLPVYDDEGGLYLLNVRHDPHETVSEKLVIRLPAPPPRADPTVFGNTIVSHTVAMMDHMLGVRNIPSISGVDATVIRDGRVRVGRRIYEDDLMTIEILRVFQGPSLRGYMCLLSYRGTEPFRIPYQRLTFPGVVAVYSPITAVVDPRNPGGLIQPGQRVPIYFVGY